ncbi:kynureninase [Mycetocola sp. CAN_C7]|uniref:kynureninase n=1 Tax=Mycetocola sp. CAN_C7 TaxID=2787724 RepID=UPI0018C92721
MNRESCVAADRRDPLSAFRAEFVLPEGILYFDGNSLGPRPVRSLERARSVVADEWGSGLIRSWNDADWFTLPSRLGDKVSRLIGAADGETVVTDTTTLNIFKTLAAAIRIQDVRDPSRRVLLSERDNFPTDLYIAEGLIEFIDRGYELRLVDGPDDLAGALGPDVAVVLLSHVNYRTGAMFDLAASTSVIHEAGSLVVWDLAHSAGAVPLDLTGADADFAVGCTYKYLNGGPGSPAFLWVNPRHHDDFRQPLSGWWGHARPFAMEPSFEPHVGIQRFLCGTQPVVSMSLAECGLDIALRADPLVIRHKSIELSNLFIALVEERCGSHPLTLITPRDPAARGSHVSFRHPEGYAVMQALIAHGVIGDYREPEVLRFGITPLYLGYTDVWDAVEILRDLLDTGAWDRPEFYARTAVT